MYQSHGILWSPRVSLVPSKWRNPAMFGCFCGLWVGKLPYITIHNPYPYSLYKWYPYMYLHLDGTFPKCLVIWGMTSDVPTPFRVIFVAAEMSQAKNPWKMNGWFTYSQHPMKEKEFMIFKKNLQGIMCKMFIFRGVSVYFWLETRNPNMPLNCSSMVE